MASLTEILSEITGQAFAACDLPSELGRVILSDRPDLAPFQCNGAMAAAKIAKKNPRQIAESVVDVLKRNPLTLPSPRGGEGCEGLAKPEAEPIPAPDEGEKIFSKIEIAGPGFINLDVSDEFLADHLKNTINDDRLGVPKSGDGTIILDYGGPNVAKPMHVGHLRTAIIGDSLRRIMKFSGYETIGDVHIGDWGTPMGMVLSAMEEDNITDPVTMDMLEEIYPRATKACQEDESRMEKARKATLKLQEGDKNYRAQWRKFVDVSIAGMKKNYDALGIHFDLWKGESDVHDLIFPMVEDMKKKNHAVESAGALVVPVQKNDDDKEYPPLILYKSDGAVMYGTTDLATILDRVKTYQPVKIIYIVDQRQHLHFEQVFRAARLTNIVPEGTELTHAGFGTMNGTDGKPFKTRTGGVMRLEDFIAAGLEKAQTRMAEAALAQDMTTEEKEDIAHKVVLAAIKFADLQNPRQSDYILDIERMTGFEGKTGPYLMYQAVRIKSLLRKAAQQGDKPGDEIILHDGDRSLALTLTELPDALNDALRGHAPHHLCDYAYRLATTFSSFYASCHILSEQDESLRKSRLALCDLTQRQLVLLLDLLGIESPDRM